MNNKSGSLVSVIIPSYNHCKYLEECIESVINQTYSNIQLIVIDDGSSDGSQDLIIKLSKKYDFIFELQQNIGLTATLNKAINKYVEGKYLRIIASDDKLTSNSIFDQYHFLEKNKRISMCVANAYKMNEQSKVYGNIVSKVSGIDKDQYMDYILGKIVFNITTCFYKTQALIDVGLYNENVVCEDIYMNRLILKNYKVGRINKFVSYYRIYSGNSSKNNWLMYQESKSLLELDKDQPYYNVLLERRALQWFYSLSTEHKKESLKYFWKASKFFNSKLFIAGCLNIIGLGIIEKILYAKK